MPFGSQVSNQTPVFTERHVQASWNAQIGQGQAWQPFVTSMTMPFTGDLFVELWVQVNYTPEILAAQVWPATPIGPTNFWAGKLAHFDPSGGWFVVPFFGRWANLAKGTYFDLTIQIRCVVCGGTMGITGADGFIRAKAS